MSVGEWERDLIRVQKVVVSSFRYVGAERKSECLRVLRSSAPVGVDQGHRVAAASTMAAGAWDAADEHPIGGGGRDWWASDSSAFRRRGLSRYAISTQTVPIRIPRSAG